MQSKSRQKKVARRRHRQQNPAERRTVPLRVPWHRMLCGYVAPDVEPDPITREANAHKLAVQMFAVLQQVAAVLGRGEPVTASGIKDALEMTGAETEKVLQHLEGLGAVCGEIRKAYL